MRATVSFERDPLVAFNERRVDMSGSVLLAAPVRDYIFSLLGDGAIGACTIASQIDASPWTECVLEVNILSSDITGTSKI